MLSLLDLLGTKDIARMLGVTQAHTTNRIVTRPDFPRPAVNLSQRLRKWKRADVEAYVLGKKPC
jgi:predicted DNA-binding transcriptional regulator AlpA